MEGNPEEHPPIEEEHPSDQKKERRKKRKKRKVLDDETGHPQEAAADPGNTVDYSTQFLQYSEDILAPEEEEYEQDGGAHRAGVIPNPTSDQQVVSQPTPSVFVQQTGRSPKFQLSKYGKIWRGKIWRTVLRLEKQMFQEIRNERKNWG